MGILHAFIMEFLHLLQLVLPFFILGVGAGALLESNVNVSAITKWIGVGPRAIVSSSALGAILPGCACATMPMAEGLIRQGARLSSATAFVMTSPLLAPQTVILTLGMLGPQFAIARVVCGLLGGMGIGFLVHVLEQRGWVNQPDGEATLTSCCQSEKKPGFFKSAWSISKKLGLYLLGGLAIASALTVLVPPSAIPSAIGHRPLLSYIIATFVGIPIYICEGEEIPFTHTLLSLGLAPGPSFTFLLGAVGTCIPTLMFAKKILGTRPMVVYAIYWALFAPLCGMLFSLII